MSAGNRVSVTVTSTAPNSLYSAILPYRLLSLRGAGQQWDSVASLQDHIRDRVGTAEWDQVVQIINCWY